jgi:adenosylcobyric acid synthase
VVAKALMIQGVGSDVGKSMLVAGLARAYTRRGLKVRPFKSQNMSNNAAATAEGGEIGRAQALQARAAGLEPHIDMNPVLLKPDGERTSQIVVSGKVWGRTSAQEYPAIKPKLLPLALAAFARNAQGADLVLVEGAGGAAEVNLRNGDIANMGFAEAANLPVILVGDIERGGVIAGIVGSWVLLDDADRGRLKGYIVNKFRGDPALFDPAIDGIGLRTGMPCNGVVPWFADASRLPAEDSMALAGMTSEGTGAVKIAVPVLPRIANFDDLDPLRAEPDVSVQMVRQGEALPGDADVILLPGSKATLHDLAALKAAGWDIDIQAHVRRGGRVLGLCAGYQMLGKQINDPDGVEGGGSAEGLSLLDVSTVLAPAKTLGLQEGLALGEAIRGYEMHMGRTIGPDAARPFVMFANGDIDGANDRTGRITGTYLHGLFAADGFRKAFLASLGATSTANYDAEVDQVLNALADHLEAHLDLDALLAVAQPCSAST